MELKDAIKKRRSIRKFTDGAVTKEQITAMLEAAIAAPNACNMQSWHFYAVTDAAVKDELGKSGALAAWATSAPVIFVLCTEERGLTAKFGGDFDYFAIQDTALAAENILLTAADMGLGGCFMGYFGKEKLKEIVGIKDGHDPVIVIPVGVPAYDFPARPRNPFSDTVTFVGGDGEHTDLDVNYRGFEVRNSDVSGAVFENSSLDGTTFRNCSLKNVKIENCDTEGLEIK